MKQTTYSILLIFIFSISLFSQIPNGYYDSAENLQGPDLKYALHNIIKGHTMFPYTSDDQTDTWDILKETDRDSLDNSKVSLLYTGWAIDADMEYDGGNGWSREHVWSKSHGFPSESDTAHTDVHHLRPADISVNSARGTKDFDNGGDRYIDNGAYLEDNGYTDCFSDNDSWEPRDEVKGDIARMMFYMAIRYESDGNYDLIIVDSTGTDTYTPYLGKLSTLLNWHKNDPVTDWERNRNNIIYGYQGNRNPFIDHPEYAELIWDGTTVVQFSSPKIIAYEDEGSVKVHLSIFFPDSITATNCTVSYSGGNAESGIDFSFITPQFITFAANSWKEEYIEIDILDDTEAEGIDTVIVEITQISGGNDANIGFTSKCTLLIYDNETMTGQLIISELADGPETGGLPKMLEITNTSDSSIELENYHIYEYANGGTAPSEDYIFSALELAARQSLVLTNVTSSQWISYGLSVPDIIFYSISAINGNGDDVYEIADDGGNTLDVYGVIGEDGSTTIWEYLDSYAYRKADYINGKTIFNSSEWTIFAPNTLDNQMGNLSSFLTPGTHIFNANPVHVSNILADDITFMLLPNYPNPFNPETQIPFILNQGDIGVVTIYNLKGQKITDYLINGKNGLQTLRWAPEEALSSGIYFYELKVGEKRLSKSMMYLK